MSALSLADAKTHLNIQGTSYDTELQAVIDSAEALLAQRVGPLEPTSVTRRIPGGTSVLALPITPVVSLTSVTPYQGSALTVGDLYVDKVSGLVTANNLTGFPALYYDVVFSAGRSSCPDDLLFAVKELVRLMWQPKRGPRSTNATGTDSTIPPVAHLMRYPVAELIAPHVQFGVG